MQGRYKWWYFIGVTAGLSVVKANNFKPSKLLCHKRNAASSGVFRPKLSADISSTTAEVAAT